MNHEQQSFLNRIAELIPRLLAVMQEGNQHAEYILGTRRIKGRQVRLVLRAEVVDPGMNPLATHSAGRESARESARGSPRGSKSEKKECGDSRG